jgi:hypothetical protein
MAALQNKAGLEKLASTVGGGPEFVLAAMAAAASNKTEIELTDVVFKVRHPERATKRLVPADPGDAGLIKEWVEIRHGIVRPAMQKMGKSGSGGVGSALGKALGKSKSRPKGVGGLIGKILGDAEVVKPSHVGPAEAAINYTIERLEGMRGSKGAIEALKILRRHIRFQEWAAEQAAQVALDRMTVVGFMAGGVLDPAMLAKFVWILRHPGKPVPGDDVGGLAGITGQIEMDTIRTEVVAPAMVAYFALFTKQKLQEWGVI